MDRLRLTASDVTAYAGRYRANSDDNVAALVAVVRDRGFLTKAELAIVGEWKTPRIRSRLATNSEERIGETTRLALSTASPELAIYVLQVLVGVGMPVASTVLHWFHRERFPILDFRALWTLGYDVPPSYTLEFWEEYVRATRTLADEWGTDMRTLDRALWQYSSEHQKD